MTPWRFDRHVVTPGEEIDLHPNAEVVHSRPENGALVVWTRAKVSMELPDELKNSDNLEV